MDPAKGERVKDTQLLTFIDETETNKKYYKRLLHNNFQQLYLKVVFFFLKKLVRCKYQPHTFVGTTAVIRLVGKQEIETLTQKNVGVFFFKNLSSCLFFLNNYTNYPDYK